MFIRNSILALGEDILPEQDEFRIVLNEIGIVDDDHKYIDDAIRRLDIDYQVGLAKVVEWFSKTSQWDDFISPIKSWLEAKIENL